VTGGMKAHVSHAESSTFQIAPMVDVIFILILFFMTSAGLVQVEKQLNFTLPGLLVQATSVDMPDEQIIEIQPDGQVVLNGRPYDKPADRTMPELVGLLKRYKLSSEANKSTAFVTVTPAPAARYQRIIDVMDSCAVAGITNVAFTTSAD
jgi:biopolymer transport protein ExbD